MNKLLKTTYILFSLLILLGGCKKDLEDKFYNPETSKTGSLPGFLTDIINNDRVRPSYWNVRTFLLMHSAVYSQTAFFSPGNTMYQQQDGYTNDYWKDFYSPGVLGMYRAMEVLYNAMPASEQAQNEIYMQAARVVLYDQAAQMIDNFGDIPFSEVGSLETTNTIILPKFDDQVQLYAMILDGLKNASTYFSTASAIPGFTKADILLSGKVDKWRRYSNSLRLRLLMRTSGVNESAARTAIMEMLNNPAQYPLIDGDNDGNYKPDVSDVLLMPLTNNNSDLRDAMIELPSFYAPDYMLNTVMNPANDPRIPVMFDKFGRTKDGKFTPNAGYRAMPITFTSQQVEQNYQDYSIIDSATIWLNKKVPGPVITASEVNLLKAEAQERWGSSALAETSYETAVKQSVTYYYYLNNLNGDGKKEAKPSDAIVENFISNSSIAYGGTRDKKLELIITQKWIHFGFLQSQQAWAEYRRTELPRLTFQQSTLSGYNNPPKRLLYPSIEKSNNSANYQAVQAKDTRDTRIFWDVN
ncbi:SusD/RagB family nutrient-binding outer membrane lipoprotein [Arcticibacter tournemirensis]